jgi:hypothetical protein
MGFLATARDTARRAIVNAGVISLLTVGGLLTAAAYGYAVAAAILDVDDDSDEARRERETRLAL